MIEAVKHSRAGTLGAVCIKYFDNLEHEGCPFRQVCLVSNSPVGTQCALRITYDADAETMELMAKAIRATKEDCLDETSI